LPRASPSDRHSPTRRRCGAPSAARRYASS
jgi:hypothetical protein